MNNKKTQSGADTKPKELPRDPYPCPRGPDYYFALVRGHRRL